MPGNRQRQAWIWALTHRGEVLRINRADDIGEPSDDRFHRRFRLHIAERSASWGAAASPIEEGTYISFLCDALSSGNTFYGPARAPNHAGWSDYFEDVGHALGYQMLLPGGVNFDVRAWSELRGGDDAEIPPDIAVRYDSRLNPNGPFQFFRDSAASSTLYTTTAVPYAPPPSRPDDDPPYIASAGSRCWMVGDKVLAMWEPVYEGFDTSNSFRVTNETFDAVPMLLPDGNMHTLADIDARVGGLPYLALRTREPAGISTGRGPWAVWSRGNATQHVGWINASRALLECMSEWGRCTAKKANEPLSSTYARWANPDPDMAYAS